jgi:hypothetical protein
VVGGRPLAVGPPDPVEKYIARVRALFRERTSQRR